MLCQQCGNAPCEPVCPVYATYHSPDGLNVQVYNRCVGTRYCSNNCPYKVRYFNWFGYGEPSRPQYAFPEPLNWQLNPDVTVRGKGVMEKCTFCVQRIRESEHRARSRGARSWPDEFTVACAQACPSRAITFGDAADPAWSVTKMIHDKRAYHVFEELNTYTAVVYLKKVNHSARRGRRTWPLRQCPLPIQSVASEHPVGRCAAAGGQATTQVDREILARSAHQGVVRGARDSLFCLDRRHRVDLPDLRWDSAWRAITRPSCGACTSSRSSSGSVSVTRVR
jgi:Fe-S-cluster-containing dehydrogenase component